MEDTKNQKSREKTEDTAETQNPENSAGKITIRYLQEYLKGKDFDETRPIDYLLKLYEEIGELSEAIHKNVLPALTGQNPASEAVKPAREDDFRGSVEEELWDTMYYLLCIANLYHIDMEKWIAIKERYNNARYNPGAVFAPGQKKEEKEENSKLL